MSKFWLVLHVKTNHGVAVSLKMEGDLGMCMDHEINIWEEWREVTWNLSPCWSKKRKISNFVLMVKMESECPLLEAKLKNFLMCGLGRNWVTVSRSLIFRAWYLSVPCQTHSIICFCLNPSFYSVSDFDVKASYASTPPYTPPFSLKMFWGNLEIAKHVDKCGSDQDVL